MKKRILALLIIAFSLSACQPTPEEEIVIGKAGAQGEPVAQAHAEAPAVPFAAPAQAAYEWEKNGLMVSIDAKVFVPNVDRYPIYAASNEAWSQQQLDAIVNSLTKGSQLYDANSAVYTEEELLEMLLWEQRLLSEVQSGQNTTYGGSIEQIQQNIETLQSELASLGDKRPTAIDVSDYQDIKQVSAYFYQENHRRSYITASWDTALFIRYYRTPFMDTTVLTEDEALPISLTRAEAEEMAYGCIADMGYTDMQLFATSRGQELAGEEDLDSGKGNPCYMFFFTRVVDGIPLTYEERERASSGTDGNTAYSKSWEYENIKIAVSADGIQEVTINGNMVLGEKLVENAALIPFDQIMARAEECFFQRYHLPDYAVDAGATKRVIHIDRVRLGYMQMAAQNSGAQTLTPVWDFYGWEEYLHDDRKEPGVPNRQYSYLTINAIDGSMVDRALGY